MITADNVVIGVGVQPQVPPQAYEHLGDRQFHVSEFLGLISRPNGDLPRRVVWISRRPNYFPIDDSPFTNDYYSDGISEAALRQIYQRIYTHPDQGDRHHARAVQPGQQHADGAVQAAPRADSAGLLDRQRRPAQGHRPQMSRTIPVTRPVLPHGPHYCGGTDDGF